MKSSTIHPGVIRYATVVPAYMALFSTATVSLPLNSLHRMAQQVKPISKPTLFEIIQVLVGRGNLVVSHAPNSAVSRYRVNPTAALEAPFIAMSLDWIPATDGLPENTRHVLAIIEDETEDDPFRRYRVRMLWRKMAHESAFSGWCEEPGGGGLVREDLILYWRELPAPPSEIAKHFTTPAVLKKYGARFGDHYPVLRTLLP